MTHDGADTKAEKDQPQKRQRSVEDDRAPEAKDSGHYILGDTLLWVLDSSVYLDHLVEIVVAHVSVHEVIFDLHRTVKACFPLHIQAQRPQHRFTHSTEHRSKTQLEKFPSI